MLSSQKLHRYVLIVVAIGVGLALVFIEARERSPWWEIGTAIMLGWIVGSLWPWRE